MLLRMLVVCGLVWGIMNVAAPKAEAGVGDAVKNIFSYAVTPVNCVLEFGKDVVMVSVKFVGCVIGNVNRNPATLKPIVTAPIGVPIVP